MNHPPFEARIRANRAKRPDSHRSPGGVLPSAQMPQLHRRALIGLLLVTLAACTRRPEPGPIRQYDITGVVITLNSSNLVATIQHEEIKGWMEAMTMEFPVREASEFAKLKPGSRISARVNVQGLDFWLSDIRAVATPR